MILPAEECPVYFQQYLVSIEEDILTELETQLNSGIAFLGNIPLEKLYFRYAPGKWSVKEVIGHITDTERIMADRAFRIARNDKTPLPSFDENAYVVVADFDACPLECLLANLTAVRRGSIELFKSLGDEALRRMGTASGKRVSARALFYFMVGHFRHHENLIRERYLL